MSNKAILKPFKALQVDFLMVHSIPKGLLICEPKLQEWVFGVCQKRGFDRNCFLFVCGKLRSCAEQISLWPKPEREHEFSENDAPTAVSTTNAHFLKQKTFLSIPFF